MSVRALRDSRCARARGGTGQGVERAERGDHRRSTGPDSVYLWTLPMFHCNGWCFPWAVTAVATPDVTMRAVDPERVWELIDREGVTHYNGARPSS